MAISRLLLLLAVPALALPALAGEPASKEAPLRVSLAEGRRLVRMMDDIYKHAVLATHKMYVQDAGTPSAITWAKQVLPQVEAKGWPRAHIFSGTGRPLHPDNEPKDDFERAAVRAFQGGKSAVEAVEGDTLRYASEIRVTDRSCLMCHVRNHEGDLLGGVSYRVALQKAVAGGR
jgi:hypothetical protein